MKWKYGGEQSMGRAKISWACRELQRRMAWRCPCRNHSSRLVQAARGLLWWRPLQSQLFNSFWEDTEKFGIHPGFGGAGCWRRQEGGVSYRVRQHLCIRSCHWHAVIGQLFITTTKRNQTTRTGRGTLVRMGKKDGRNLSVWRDRGTRDLSRLELALSWALKSSAPFSSKVPLIKKLCFRQKKMPSKT